MAKAAIYKDIGKPGEALIKPIIDEMKKSGFEPDSKETAALRQAALLADRQSELQAVVDKEGVTVSTTRGTAVNPCIAEIRQIAVAINKILGSVALADSTGAPKKSARHQAAANRRWSRIGTA